ncbi:MAG: D-alanine--D-alanine ligase [Sulfurovum sp. PC08-66]|jgi:D-alanine-D-alanine ligase|nr:MAG: D-alanine--D-alanine ligase [Sulfurovum sp. PC08-66]
MTIAVLFGGSSYEHEISIVSAITMKKVFKHNQLKFIFVDSNRAFYAIDTHNMKSKYFASGEYTKAKKLSLDSKGFSFSTFLGSKTFDCDVFLNLIHGRDGEDAKIASLMEFYGLPYISPRIEASVLSYNKLYTKHFAREVGVMTLEYQHLHKNDKRELKLELPVIVKPSRLGSSIGVSIVKTQEALDYALDVAFELDSDVIMEPFVEGIKEYNLAGTKTDRWELSLIEEPQKEAFLDFDKKYMDFARDTQVLQASINESLKAKLHESFKRIYDPLFLGSIIRCDFFVVDDNVYLNEINPIPGSMANYLFDDFEMMVERLAQHLPKEKPIAISYQYIHSIQQAKGKA